MSRCRGQRLAQRKSNLKLGARGPERGIRRISKPGIILTTSSLGTSIREKKFQGNGILVHLLPCVSHRAAEPASDT